MAAVTLLGTATFNTSNGTKTVTATPAVNDLIVIVTAHSGNTATTAPTDDQTGGTYTLITSVLKNANADRLCIFVRNSLVSSAVSTVYTHAPGTTSGGGLAVLKVTGMTRTGSSAVRQSGSDNSTGGDAPACLMSTGAVLTTNSVIGAVFDGANPATLTPPTSWTERLDTGYATPTSGLEVASRDSGETGSTITWGSSPASAHCSLAIELDITPVTQNLTPSLFTNTNTFYGPTVTSLYGLTAPLFTNTQVFYGPNLTNLNTIIPSVFTNTNTFYESVLTNTNSITPSLLTNTNIFYSPTITNNSQFIEPSLFTNTQIFYSPSITTTNEIIPSLVINTQVFYSPTVVPAGVNITPDLFTNINIFYEPIISNGPINRIGRSLKQALVIKRLRFGRR